MTTLTRYAPVAPVTPITPGKPGTTPIYLGNLTRTNLEVYGSPLTESEGSQIGSNQITIETDTSGTTFLQPEKPVKGDFMIFTSKANYWYKESGLVNKFSTGTKPTGDFERTLGSYAGIFQGTFAAYIDYKGVKRVKSFQVKIKLPYSESGELIDTDYLLWVPAETQFGKAAENQFEVSGNGYGTNVVIPKGETLETAKPETTKEVKSFNWLIIIAIAVWLLKK